MLNPLVWLGYCPRLFTYLPATDIGLTYDSLGTMSEIKIRKFSGACSYGACFWGANFGGGGQSLTPTRGIRLLPKKSNDELYVSFYIERFGVYIKAFWGVDLVQLFAIQHWTSVNTRIHT